MLVSEVVRRVLLCLPLWLACGCAGRTALDEPSLDDVAIEPGRPLDTAAGQAAAFRDVVHQARRRAAEQRATDDLTSAVESADVARDQVASAKCHVRHACGRVTSCFPEERARLVAWPIDECSGVLIRDCLASVRAVACLLEEGELPAACDPRLVCVRDV